MKPIPVRVPAGATLHTEGGSRQLAPGHPLYGTPCPACGLQLDDQPVTLVYVGTHPDDRKGNGWMTGAAVAVHAECAGTHTPDQQPDTTRLTAERDGAYRERARLVALVAAGLAEQAVVAPAPDVDEPGWQILYATIHGRQCSWHFSPRDADLVEFFDHVPVNDPRAQWDGHTTEAKYDHLDDLARALGAPGPFRKSCGPECSEMHTETGRCEIARNR